MHAAILGVAVSLVGIKVGWVVAPDRSVEYVIQLDADDLERFQAERTIESDVPAQVKNIRRYRIELGMGSLPPPQHPLPKEEPPPRVPGPPRDAGNRNPVQFSSVYTKGSGPRASTFPGWVMRPEDKPEDKKAAKGKQGTAAQGTGTEAKSGKQGATQTQGAGPSKPWGSLAAVLIALCGSLGGNLYLGWMMWETRRRYRGLLERQRKKGEATESS